MTPARRMRSASAAPHARENAVSAGTHAALGFVPGRPKVRTLAISGMMEPERTVDALRTLTPP
jgi:hypothetical protein